MTAHRRGHLLRAAVVGALVSGAVLLPAAPALADVNAQPGNLTLKPGEQKQITITLTGAEALDPEANISVNGLGDDITLRGPGGCNGGGGGLQCNENAFDQQGTEQRLTITVSAKNPGSVQAGQTKDGSINIDAGNDDDSVNVTLQGPQQAATVTEVSGKVTDSSTGDGIPGAEVTLKDGAGKTHEATANNQGNYSIKPSNNNPIAPGQVTVTATKDGFSDGTATNNAQAGKALSLGIRMKPVAASGEPSAPVASEPAATEEPSAPGSDPAAANPRNASNEGDGPSKLSWLLIGMGVLLVLLGIGAIVLLVMRRKDDTEGDEADPYGTNPQMAPAGAGAYGDRTMVGGLSNANDQTAIVGPHQQLDEFPDPYAAPAPAPTRVGGAYGGGYDDGPATSVAPGYGGGDYGRGGDGYANGGGYRDERGYGAQQGGYAEEPRGGYGGGAGGGYADQPTGVYQGNGANGSEYGANGSGYSGGGVNGYGGGAPGGANGYDGGGANGGANGYGPGGDGYEGDYGRRGGGDYEGDYGRRGGNDYQR